jgi:hypothetical protein
MKERVKCVTGIVTDVVSKSIRKTMTKYCKNYRNFRGKNENYFLYVMGLAL